MAEAFIKPLLFDFIDMTVLFSFDKNDLTLTAFICHRKQRLSAFLMS